MRKILFGIFACILMFNDTSAQSAQSIVKAMSSGKKAKIKPEYNFAGSLKFQTNAIHNGKSTKGTMQWYFPVGNENIFGTTMSMDKTPNVRSVIDYKEKSMVMFMEDQKMVMGIPLDIEATMKDVQNDPKTRVSAPKKTGRTKSILGYTCDEWVVENAEHLSSFWMSQKLPVSSGGFYQIMSQQLFSSTGTPMPANMKGVPLEIETTNKKSKEKYSMVCTEISNKPTRFTTAGYKTM